MYYICIMQYKQLPPRNEEAEQAVLGSMLFSREAIDIVSYKLRAEDFSVNSHKVIFNAILDLDRKNHTADILTTVEELRRQGNLEKTGGASYIAGLTNVIPSITNIEYYADVVLDSSVRRSLFYMAHQTLADVFDESLEYRKLVEKIEGELFKLMVAKQSQQCRVLKDIVPKVVEDIEKRVKTKNAIIGVPSGFSELDYMTCGFQPSDYIVIGARPSVGKTALALSMVSHISIKKQIPAAFFSLEMPDVSLVMRMLAGEARVDSKKIKTGFLRSSDFVSLISAAGAMYEAPLYIVNTPNIRFAELRTQARRLRTHEKVEIIFIDYMTLITPENTKLQTYEQYTEVSKSLKNLARELEIPIVVLSQLGRGTQEKDPKLSDIRASGGIEQDADLVVFLMRERNATKAKLRIEKQRNGETGDLEIAFLPQYMKFENLLQEEK